MHVAQETIFYNSLLDFFSFYVDLVCWGLLHLPWVIIVFKRIKTNMRIKKVTHLESK